MGFDKEYPNRKDWRGKYHGSKAVDRTCRSHGSCPHCQQARKYKKKRQEPMEDINHKEGR